MPYVNTEMQNTQKGFKSHGTWRKNFNTHVIEVPKVEEGEKRVKVIFEN